jgi:hypothetical protein
MGLIRHSFGNGYVPPQLTGTGSRSESLTSIMVNRDHWRAAEAYGFDFRCLSLPAWGPYASLLEFADTVRTDLRLRDMIDIQSFHLGPGLRRISLTRRTAWAKGN